MVDKARMYDKSAAKMGIAAADAAAAAEAAAEPGGEESTMTLEQAIKDIRKRHGKEREDAALLHAEATKQMSGRHDKEILEFAKKVAPPAPADAAAAPQEAGNAENG